VLPSPREHEVYVIRVRARFTADRGHSRSNV
jgi:hypothetical protein